MDKTTAISLLITDWSNDSLVTCWNERCDQKECSDEIVINMCEFDDLHSGMKPTEVIDLVRNTNFCTSDDYFGYNRYGNLVSFDNITEFDWFDMDELAEFLGECGSELVDTDELKDDLVDYFIEEYFDDEYESDIIKQIIEDNDFNVLTDDWLELALNIRELLDGENDDE